MSIHADNPLFAAINAKLASIVAGLDVRHHIPGTKPGSCWNEIRPKSSASDCQHPAELA